MTSMVERMARIIDPEAFRRHAELYGRLIAAWATPEVAKEMASKESGEVYAARSKALAALREMREPTEVMLRAVLVSARDLAASEGATELRPEADYAKEYVGHSFTAAIDAEIAAYEADHASPVLRPPS